MPIEIRRFGVGHRRPYGPDGSSGAAGQTIHAAEDGVVAEVAFSKGARIEPHSSPDQSWFVVIEGGGWVSVGDERARVAAGEAVLWPPGIEHAAWTDLSEMRAIVVELRSSLAVPRLIEGRVVDGPSDPDPAVDRGEGSLRRDAPASTYDPAEGEPL